MVSVLVPIYKVEQFIANNARSLLKQTYPFIEYIFVDDCSPDNSVAILKSVLEEFPHRKNAVKIIKHEKNRGLAAARNTGLDHCSGNCVMFVDSDDTLDPTTVEECVNKYSENNDIVIYGMKFVFENGTSSNRVVPKISEDLNQYVKNILFRNVAVNVCGSLIRKDLFDENNIRFIEGIDYGEDYTTIPRLVSCAKSIGDLTDRYLYNYYQGNPEAYTFKWIGRKQIDSIISGINHLEHFFSGRYTNSIDFNLVKLRNKLFLLEYCDDKELAFVDNLYSDIQGKERLSKILTGKHLIVWNMYNHLPLGMFKYAIRGLRTLQAKRKKL